MKKLLISISFLLIGFFAKGQFYGFEGQPVCWDSSGTKIQLYAVNFYVIGNTAGTFIGYMDKAGSNRTVSVSASDLTEGFCDQIALLEKVDTISDKSCVYLTRQLTNTADGSTLYPGQELEKHTYTVGGEIVEVKYYVPETDSLVTSPVMGISIKGCNNFNILNFGNMLYEGDTVLISAGDTLTIDPTSEFSTLTIACDRDNMESVKLIIDYLPVTIDGSPYGVAGTNTSMLTTYTNSYYQSWQYQMIDQFRLVAIGADCRCNYVVSHEKNGF